MRRTLEKALDGTKCMFFPGAEGDEGGYEARTSRYAPGVAERIIAGGKQLLDEMRK